MRMYVVARNGSEHKSSEEISLAIITMRYVSARTLRMVTKIGTLYNPSHFVGLWSFI